LLFPDVRCSICYELLETCPDVPLECEPPGECPIPKVSKEIKIALAIRQDIYRLKKMGWPEKYRECYITREYAPDIKIMHLSMIADEYIENLTKPKTGDDFYARQKNPSRT